MAACSIFDEDEVCIPTSSGGFKYGLVVESSEYISSDEEDDEDENRVQRGTVKIAWHPSGDETVVPEKKLILTDRSLMPGDVVRRLISGEESQRGYVQTMEMKCHVKILGTEQYIYNIDARNITPIQEWDPEPEVTLDSWVGHIIETNEDITIKFPDGARCKLTNAGLLGLEDLYDKRKSHSEFVMRNFYPGQEVCGCQEDFEEATWLHTTKLRGSKSTNTNKNVYSVPVVVEKVETESVDVRWICKGFTRKGAGADKLESPPSSVKGENLKRMRRLDCFEHCHLQIGDKAYYTIQDGDSLVHNMNPRKHVTPDIVNIMAKENVTVIGTRSDGLVVTSRDVEKSAKSETDQIQSGTPKDKDKTVDNVADKNGDATNVDVNDCGINPDDILTPVNDSGDDEADGSESGASDSASDGFQVVAPRRRNRKRPCVQTRSMKKLKGKRAKKKARYPVKEFKTGDKVPIEVWYTFSTCCVMWQDGTEEEKVPSPELFPIHHLDELEFFPGDFVVDAKVSMSMDYGVVVNSDHKERTILVKWFKPYMPGKPKIPDEDREIEMSVYDVKDHPDYQFRPGNTVIRVAGYEDDGGEVEAVGQVYGLAPDGTVKIWWPDGTITHNYPQDLYIISEEFNSEGSGSTDGWTDEEEQSEESGSDVSWETEEEGEGDTGDESDKDDTEQGSKQWSVNDTKKKDIDELLQRVQAALTGLLDIFMNVPGPFFKNSRQVFQDILAIFKRCKEMEKVLKSNYFDDEDIADLITEIKDELRKEKTSKFARHVAQVYKYRTNAQDPEIEDKSNNQSETVHGAGDIAKNAEDAKRDLGEEAEKIKAGYQTETERLREVLINYGANLADPIEQIIFDTTLHASVAKSAMTSIANVNTQSHGAGVDCHIGDGIKDVENEDKGKSSIASGGGINGHISSSGDCDKTERVTDIIQKVISSVCDEKDEGLNKALHSIREKMEEMCNKSETDSLDTDGSGKTAVKSESSNGTPLDQSNMQASSETEAESLQKAEEKEADAALPSSHRDLSIRVCKALNSRLLHIQQEVHKRWLAFKFGFNENDSFSDIELFEKMQEKMVESVESRNGPFSLNMDNVGATEKDGVVMVENVQELQDLIEARASPTGGNSCASGEDGASKGGSPDKDAGKGDEDVLDEGNIEDTTEEQETEDAGAEMLQGVMVTEKQACSITGFEQCSETPSCHWFKYQEKKPNNMKTFSTAVRKELMLLQSSLPEGILVKAFEDRMDLFSVLIEGPTCTPYEDGLFTFDVQLPADFPSTPPEFHYLSFCSERLNPNLYEDGKVCVSLLGTWTGKGNEVWTNKSNLLQVLVSIQGLILVSEPYFNEAGYEKQRGSQHGQENSRMYNELAILKLVQSMTKMAVTPPAMFVEETRSYLHKHGPVMIERIQTWIEMSNKFRQGGHSDITAHISQSKPSSESVNQSPSDKTPDNQSDLSIPMVDQVGMSNGTASQSEIRKKACDLPNGEHVAVNTKPDFPLLPASKGFCITMKSNLDIFRNVLSEHIHIKV